MKTAMPPQRLDQLRAEQVAGFYRNSTAGTVGGILAALILSTMLVYEKAVSWHVATIFVLLLAASTLARLVLIDIYGRAKPPAEDWRRWAFWAIVRRGPARSGRQGALDVQNGLTRGIAHSAHPQDLSGVPDFQRQEILHQSPPE